MAPQEVAGLQALAKAHGGTLTTNPDTGLPEAGFLKKLLPTLIGAGLSIASGGALTPLMAAGLTGAGYGIASGSLSKGLMAGLGAYGGAGLAGGLTAAGAAGATELGAAGASEMAGTNAALQQNAATGLGLDSTAAAGTGSMSFAPNMSTNVLGTVPTAGPMSVPVSAEALTGGASQVATATPIPSATPMADNFSQLGRGVQNLGTEAGRDAFMGGVGGGMGLLKSGYAAATPLMMQDPQNMGAKEEEKPYEYSYDPGRVDDPNAGYTGAQTGERRYFNHKFTRTAADGGLMGLGAVQAMSDRNMAETMQANGGQMYAEGGATRAVRPVEENPYYTMSGQSGDAFKYLMGQAPASKPAPAPVVGPTPPASTESGFLKGLTGIAGPDGITDIYTGVTKPWSADNPAPTGGGFFGAPGPTPAPAQDSGTGGGGATPEYTYTFDPVTNRYSRTVKPVDSSADAAPVSTPLPGVDPSGGGGGGDGLANGGIAALAQGGQINLQGTIDMGGGGGGQFGQAGDNGYKAAGSGSAGQFGNQMMASPAVMPNTNPYRQMGMDDSGRYDELFTQAKPQGFQQPAAGQGALHARAEQQARMLNGRPVNTFMDRNYGRATMDMPQTSGEMPDFMTAAVMPYANGGMTYFAQGGPSHLGDYSDGGRLLRGPGDGVSDSIPASIGDKRPARLADGEFVVPARIVSELGNGSTEAGARKLYAMMDRVQNARKKSIGKNRVAVNSRSEKMLPA
jgi:hypothetical protein